MNTENLKTLPFHDRVARGLYAIRYWIDRGLPLPPNGAGPTNLTMALWESFRHDLLAHHGQYTKRANLRIDPEPAPALIPSRRSKKSAASTVTVIARSEPEFAEWAHKMLTASESEVNDLGRCQNPHQNQIEVARVFDRRLEEFRRAEKLASLPLTATIEDKIDAGYYEQHGYEQFRRDLLTEAGFTGTKREMNILRKAEEIADDDGLSRVADEFRGLVQLMNGK